MISGMERQRMKSGTNRRTRGLAMRQENAFFRTRASRERPLPTENGHAALPPVTRVYQSDSSSKSPVSSVASPFPSKVLSEKANRFENSG